MTKSSAPITTRWQCSLDTSTTPPTASLTYSLNGGAPTGFVIKGVCYSPAPVGGSNNWYGDHLGDWFWDAFGNVSNWSGTWSNDLPKIAQLGANTIRVYSFLDAVPTVPPPSPGASYTHRAFLDACYDAGLFVIVGIPLPQQMFILNQTPQPSASWWQTALQQTVSEVADHPAVLGFIIANEVDDGNVDTYGPTANATYWWGQVQVAAQIAKTAAPDKLVGIANHDDPGICANAANYMATCPAIDFWGVNSYQPQSFASVFGGSEGFNTGYALLTGAALKPVILTEYGFPATSRVTADTLCPMAGMVSAVVVSSGGSGYTTPPAVTFAAAPTGGTTATGIATVANGVVTGVTITNAGSGYLSAPTVTFAAPGSGGTTAGGTTTISQGIYSDATTQANVATVLDTMLPAAYAESVCLGLCYFEFCDEWWNQSGYGIAPAQTCPAATGPNAPSGGAGGSFAIPNVFTWYGGPIACGFPNYYWDNDGFGLYAVAPGAGRTPSQPWNQSGNAPALPLDSRTARTPVIDAVTGAFTMLFTVQSTQGWQDTGVTVTAGQGVSIAYVRGLWTSNPHDNNGELFDAAGNPNYVANQPGYTMDGQNEGALIGRIGSGPVFLVGDGPTSVPSGQSGNLQLCINDDLNGRYGAGLKDNLGNITVAITS
ncbi:MAG: cellulase family glycosylhydrolase [Opitutae bacterium]|nr:cellulase family glycosylhydrolase [Opitutae bacterium]